MSTSEILAELPRLSLAELQMVQERILDLNESQAIEPSAEFSAAIDAGLRSLASEPVVSPQEVRQKIAQWAGLSS